MYHNVSYYVYIYTHYIMYKCMFYRYIIKDMRDQDSPQNCP